MGFTSVFVILGFPRESKFLPNLYLNLRPRVWSTVSTEPYICPSIQLFTVSSNSIYIPQGYIRKPFVDMTGRGIEYNLLYVGYSNFSRLTTIQLFARNHSMIFAASFEQGYV